MTSSNGNIFRVTGHLCGEFTGPGEFPAQRPVTRSFDVSFDLRLNKRLSKQSWGWWFEALSRPLWRRRNVQPIRISHAMTKTRRVIIIYHDESYIFQAYTKIFCLTVVKRFKRVPFAGKPTMTNLHISTYQKKHPSEFLPSIRILFVMIVYKHQH